MAKQQIDIGVEGNDGTGDSIRESFRKVNENFTELYAVFGIGGQISLTDLSDTPNSYVGQENKVPAVKADGSGIDFFQLASDNDLDGSADTIGFDFSVDGKLIIKQLISKVSNDPEPTLSGPLNAATQPIANVAITQGAIDTFNSVYGTNFDIGSLVIDKNYADRNYQTKEVTGGGIRLGDEPTTVSQYTLTATGLNLSNLNIPGHGLSEAYNGAPFVFRSTGTDPFGVDTGSTYYIRVADTNNISLYETESDAVNATGRILLSGGTGTFTITDAAYDEDLPGNWLNNVALPRKSIVRRQGDTMEGLLNLSDHPGELSGFGLPNGPDDLQAATKLYVDSVASTSQVNLFVSTSGDDRQTYTPVGKEGRSAAYAYRTINAAARKAEEIIEASPYEPGPYMQTLTYNNGLGKGTVVSPGITTAIGGRNNARALILLNKEFIAKEVTAYIDTLYPEFVGSYDTEICQRDVELILESVSLDAMRGNNANYLSRWAGIRYYSNPSAQKAIGSQKAFTLAGINYAKTLVTDYILTNTAPPTLYQDRVEQYIDATGATDPDVDAATYIGLKFDIITDIINDGILQAPQIVDGSVNYEFNISNGNFGFIDQANPENQDIIPGKVIRGKNSGALGRIIEYIYESDPTTDPGIAETDKVIVELLKPIEFEAGEELEYGNIVRETQISIRVESGIYEEDYPIRVPANVSIKGDEFRRAIVRPKNRVSQSRYANLYFYRDREFDELVLGNSAIGTIELISAADSNRVAGTYTVTTGDWTTDGYGQDAEFEVTVDANGAVTDITITNFGKSFRVGDVITITDAALGDGGAVSVQIRITFIDNGIEYRNPLTNEVEGYFGYHYLDNPGSLKNIGAGYTNVGNWEKAALTLIDNKEYIQEQVVNYLEDQYPALIGNPGYSRVTCSRDVGLIVDALVKDLRNGGNEFALEAQGEYYAGAVEVGTEDETVAGIQYIYTIASKLFLAQEPDTVYGIGLNYPEPDFFNGTADPADWVSDELYRVGNVIRFLEGLSYRYFQCAIENTSSNDFTVDQDLYWTEIDGPDTTLQNLVNTVAFAFNNDYNPPKRNDELDVFLMNDATIIRNLTVQGHGGFMCVLDPEGQVLTKSPYIQTGSSFSKSINAKQFAGGLFIDAFTGNAAVQVTERVDGNPFKIRVQSLGDANNPQGLFVRRPQTPSAFYIDGKRFQVNAVTNYNKDFGTADLILDRSSNDGNGFLGTTSGLITGVNLTAIGTFDFDTEKCDRDTRYILEGVGYDLALGTNYNSVLNGLAYRRGTASVVIDEQLTQTVTALGVGKIETQSLSAVTSAGAAVTVGNAWDEVIDIIQNGIGAADALTWTSPTAGDINKTYARALLQANRSFIATEVTDWVTANFPLLTYDIATCQRDVGYIVDALSYDIQYGGNHGTIRATEAYFDGAVSVLPTQDQKDATEAAMGQLATVVGDIVTESYAGQTLTGNPATIAEVNELTDLVSIIETVINSDTLAALPVTVYPLTNWATTAIRSAKSAIDLNTAVIARKVVQSVESPLPITLQTAGNRSMLGNDFTQVNDLGYGLVCVNGALSEMVSMFTYYCWTSYYSKNGSEIRSLTGSSCYGEYGLVAEGSDPNEIPDAIALSQDMVLPAKTFAAEAILTLTGPVVVQAGDVITQLSSGATGTVIVDSSQPVDGGTGSSVIYLTAVTGAFDASNELQITGPITGDSTVVSFGPDSVPLEINQSGYSNPAEQLYIFTYDFNELPSNRSEFDLYHPDRPAFARYEVANLEDTGIVVGRYERINDYIAATTVDASGTASGFVGNLDKTVSGGYSVTIVSGGADYTVGDTITVDGTLLGGTSGGIGVGNDAIVEIIQVDGAGAVTEVAVTGDIYDEPTTPVYNGRVYKLNFSTSDVRYSTNGLLNAVGWGDFITYRRNQTHILNDIAAPDVLSIRPSTAVIFNESPDTVYRSISFLTSDSLGNDLDADEAQAGFDSTYDYIRLIIEATRAGEAANSGTGTTKGATIGDVVLAVQPTVDANEIFRLNNNFRTPEANRPTGWTSSTLVEAPIFTWGGKKFYVYNYRGVDNTNTVVEPAEDNYYGIVDIEAVGEDITKTAITGLTAPVILGSETVTIRAGLKAGALGSVTINISTCRATSHDFLDVGTGGFNQSNYPNVIFGLPREADQAKEVDERGKGRVFYVSTDQNGIFRVGRFFSVDQGTGTVTFSASLALSDVDGLGFKRGVVITEFSTDTAMTDNASDTVPTESAVRGYVNRRLGYDVTGAPVANKLGPGVLAPNGAVPMTDDLNAAGNTITNLKTPDSDSDAATKLYVDSARGEIDELNNMRDIENNDVDSAQFLVTTGYKKIYISVDTIGGIPPFEVGDNFTGSITGGTGTIADIEEVTGYEGDLLAITYTPTNAIEISDGVPDAGPSADTIIVVGGATGLVVDGPMDEWANGIWDAASDLEFSVTKNTTIVGTDVTERNHTVNVQYKANSIVNADVNASAGILQSKLSLNAATTRADATGITQNDLGVASFDSANFDATDGWISIKNNGIALDGITQIATKTALGNSTGATGNITAVPFSTIVTDGGGLADSDFTTTVGTSSDPGEALIKTGTGTYAVSNVTKTGEVNSIVKTDASGSIQVNSLILGGNPTYEVLSLDTTTLQVKTPAQGIIFEAVGDGSTTDNGNVTAEFRGSINVAGTGIAESTLQNVSNFNGEPVLAVDWIYSSFIEAPGEKGAASTGLAIGANTGITTAGQVGVVVGDSATSQSLVPALFSKTGFTPDTDLTYNIGSSLLRYNTVYANLFYGTALEAYYADLAENYTADDNYDPGTVLVFGGEAELTVTTTKGDYRAAGVVSTEPATLMNSHLQGDNVVPLALQGRVPCKVLGKVRKGDMIVTSATPGYGVVDNNPRVGTVIGKALENKDDTGKGVIEVVVGKH